LKLLIAEDDLTSRTMLDAVARQWGYETVVVEDGEAAWQALQEEDPPRVCGELLVTPVFTPPIRCALVVSRPGFRNPTDDMDGRCHQNGG